MSRPLSRRRRPGTWCACGQAAARRRLPCASCASRAAAGRPGRHDGAVPWRQGAGRARHPAGAEAVDLEFLRVYSVATGRLLRAWTGPLNVAWDAYTTLAWTGGGRQLAIGYTWYAKSAQYLGVRTVDVPRPGHDLVADSRG